MPIYKFSCKVTVSASTEVEADTLEEATEEAVGRDVVIGGLNSGTCKSESWLIEDADGSPDGIQHDDDV